MGDPVAVAVAAEVAAAGDDSIKGTEEQVMVSHKTFARRTLMVAVSAGAVLLGAGVPAQAQPPAPPNCSAADLAGVMSGVTAGTSVYLFTHPPVNDFFTSLKGMSRDEKKAALETFLNVNPQVKAELEGIRQPAKDFRARCG